MEAFTECQFPVLINVSKRAYGVVIYVNFANMTESANVFSHVYSLRCTNSENNTAKVIASGCAYSIQRLHLNLHED